MKCTAAVCKCTLIYDLALTLINKPKSSRILFTIKFQTNLLKFLKRFFSVDLILSEMNLIKSFVVIFVLVNCGHFHRLTKDEEARHKKYCRAITRPKYRCWHLGKFHKFMKFCPLKYIACKVKLNMLEF